MSDITPIRRFSKPLVSALWLASLILVAKPCSAEDRVTSIYTLPDTPIKNFQNKLVLGSISNDRKIFLGSVGSDLWHGSQDAPDEFWMITDRGPNGQIKVDGSNRRTFWVPEFNPMILKIKTVAKEIRILEALPIVGQSGRPVTGLPNRKGLDETPYNYSAQELLGLIPTVSTPKGWSARPRGISGSWRNTVPRSCM